MEAEHRDTFAAMEDELSDEERRSTVFDPQNELGMYLRAFVGGAVFDTDQDPAALLTGQESPDEVLKRAIELEKDSIAFYNGIEGMVSERLGRARVREIIHQEMGHIATLADQRLDLKQRQ
jgi:rubrerythrin